MKLLQRMSIKAVMTGIFSILLAFLIVQAAVMAVGAYKNGEEATRMAMANELADHIITAAGWEAIERGVTTTALSSDKAADSATVQKITDLRSKGDEAWKKGWSMAKTLEAKDSSNVPLKDVLKRVEKGRADLESARGVADSNLSKENKNYPSQEWFKVITAFIDFNADLRLAALTSPDRTETLQDALRLNLELKQAVWLASEYAGRERATIGGIIASAKPIDQAVMEKLKVFRAIVDINVKPIIAFKEYSKEQGIKDAVAGMEKIFLSTFEDVRRSVYGAASTGKYPISAKEWIEKSTEAINTILSVASAVNKAVDKDTQVSIVGARRNMLLSTVILIVAIILGAASFLIIRNKIISPLHYLSSAMTTIEETGDLTMNIEVRSSDENGRMAKVFNKMIGKFHDITMEIRNSMEHLASASDGLSASATQIARGSDEQTARASQVATASQEMSATVVEVAKNASGAAEAAKEANKTALKGSEIMGKTIESINGIAATAKESSQVIASLGNRSQDIGKIIKVIDDIASQTNLLALNAAIEAARAGEQGRGFAVVADEVRKLAERTTKATKEITDMIKAMQDDTGRAVVTMDSEIKAVENGVKLAEDAGASLKEIVAQVDKVTGMIQQIATAAEEQSTAADQISGDIETVANITKEASTGAKQIAQASQEIAQLASGLQAIIAMFKVSGQAAVQGTGRPALRVIEPVRELAALAN